MQEYRRRPKTQHSLLVAANTFTHQGGLAFSAAIIQPEDKRAESICASILLLKMGLKKSQSHLIATCFYFVQFFINHSINFLITHNIFKIKDWWYISTSYFDLDLVSLPNRVFYHVGQLLHNHMMTVEKYV